MACLAETLSPIMRIDSGVGPMNCEAAFLDALGEIGVLRQEAVARVDRLGVGDFGRGDDGRHVEIALRATAAGPMQTASSASLTYLASRSASE